jgi:hypothetical protein
MQERIFDEKKFENAVLFFAKNTDPKLFGKTKLNKLLFHSDFLHYKRYGRSITGDRYVKMPYGPVPSAALAIIDSASDKGTDMTSKTRILKSIRIRNIRLGDKIQSRIEALTEPDLSVFSESELEVLKEITALYKNRTGTRMSKDSHLPDGPWAKTGDFQTIDYELSLDKTGDSLPKSYIRQWKKEGSDLAEILAG